jgi:hypothetical protein
MAQAKAKTPVPAKKAPKAAAVVCALCKQDILPEDGDAVLFNGKMYHPDDCIKAAQRNAGVTSTKPKKAAIVAEPEEDEEEVDVEEEDDEDEEEEEIVAEADEEEEEDEEDEEEEEDEDEDEDEEEEEEPAPRRRVAAPAAPVKLTASERMAAARAAKAAKKTAAVEEYDDEDEPAPKRAVAKAGAVKAPVKPKVDVKIPAGVELRFGDNPARPGTKRWALLEAMARVPRTEMQAKGPGDLASIHKVASRLLSQIAKANPSLELAEKDIDTKSVNVPWFATDKGKADIFKNGASGWAIAHDEENDTYRIFKKATKK